MKALLSIASAVAMAGLVGCSTPTTISQTGTTATNTAVINAPYQVTSRTFECQNGFMPKITYLSTEQARIDVQEVSQVLNIAPSGSGARYVSNTGLWGTGAEWHEKGGEAYFAFKGTDGSLVETQCKAV